MGRLSSLLIGVISGASAAYYLSTEQGKKVTKKVVRVRKRLSRRSSRST